MSLYIQQVVNTLIRALYSSFTSSHIKLSFDLLINHNCQHLKKAGYTDTIQNEEIRQSCVFLVSVSSTFSTTDQGYHNISSFNRGLSRSGASV